MVPSRPHDGRASHPDPGGPRLDAPAGGRHRHGPLGAGLALARGRPPRDGGRRRLPRRRARLATARAPGGPPDGHRAAARRRGGAAGLEAAACATPTAALRVGGLGEAIVDGQTGVLVGTPAELVEQVSALLDAPERLEAMGRAALSRARAFTWDNTASGTLEVMTRTIGV